MKEQHIFICHASKDKKIARALYAYLEERGLSCWIDHEGLQPGNSYLQGIMEAIYSCSMMIVLMSQNTSESVYIPNEVERAFQLRKPILPVKIDKSTFNKALELPLASIHYLDAFGRSTEDYFYEIYESCLSIRGGEYKQVFIKKPVSKVKNWWRVSVVISISLFVIVVAVYSSVINLSGNWSLPKKVKPDTLVKTDTLFAYDTTREKPTPGIVKKDTNIKDRHVKPPPAANPSDKNSIMITRLADASFSENRFSDNRLILNGIGGDKLAFTLKLGVLHSSGEAKLSGNYLKITSKSASGTLTLYNDGTRIKGSIIFKTEDGDKIQNIDFFKL
jgi:hypothetical protein